MRRILAVLGLLFLAATASAQDTIYYKDGQVFFAIEPSANRLRLVSTAILDFPQITSGGTGTPGGASTFVQYNAGSGIFGGSSNMTFSGDTLYLSKLTLGSTGITYGISGPIGFTGALAPRLYTLPDVDATILTTNSTVSVNQGGTGITSGTSGGIPYFSSTSTLSSSALLSNNQVMLGGGAAGAPKVIAAPGTATQVLHGGTPPTWSTLNVGTEVIGTMAASHGGLGITTTTDDTTIVANGSVWVAAPIPNCIDTAGQHINYTAASNTYSCGTSGGGGGGGTPGGADTQVQFNDGGVFGGDGGMTYVKAADELSVAHVKLPDGDGSNLSLHGTNVSSTGAYFEATGGAFVAYPLFKLRNLDDLTNIRGLQVGFSGSEFQYTFERAGTAAADNLSHRFITTGTGNIVLDPSAGGVSVLNSTAQDAANAIWATPAGAIVAEGASVNTFETSLTFADATVDRTITLPNLDGDVAVMNTNGYTVRTASGAFSARTITSGLGTIVTNGDGVSANTSIALDDAVVDTFTSGTGAVAATGAIGTFYFRTDKPAFYLYPAADAEYWALSLPAGTGTSGGIPYFTATGDLIASSAALTANMPVIGGGAGATPAVGSRSGNTTQFVTTTGSLTANDCVKIDANGNFVANGAACGGGAGFDPSTTVEMYDEFMSGSNTSTQIGSLGWSSAILSTGTTGVGSLTNNPGTIALQSHATNDNSGAAINPGTGSVNNTNIWANFAWTLDAVVYFGNQGDGAANTGFWFGLSNTASGILTASSMIGIERDTDLSHTTYIGHICDSATTGCQSAGADTNQEVVTSTITPADNAAHRFRVSFSPTAGPGSTKKVTMQVDNETALTFCSSGCTTTVTQFPTTTMTPVIGFVTRTTTEIKSADVDYFRLTIAGLTRY